jgi:hypothetical protein
MSVICYRIRGYDKQSSSLPQGLMITAYFIRNIGDMDHLRRRERERETASETSYVYLILKMENFQ